MPVGAYRRVIFLGPYAVKTPRLRNLRQAMRCNRWEREMWQVWRPQFAWCCLCPVLAADPFGLFVVMPRAQQPVTREQAAAVIGKVDEDLYIEIKPENFGLLAGQVVALDYGQSDLSEVISARRHYLKRAR